MASSDLPRPRIFGTGPVLPVHAIGASIEWYVSQLGFARDFGEEIHPGHGSVTRDRVGIQFTCAPEGYTAECYPGWFYFFVENIDALHAEFRARGVAVSRPLASEPHGMREFEIEDADGYRLRFGQYL